jgi:hypothetical protein
LAGGVKQKRGSAKGRILVCDVEQKRPRSGSGVEAAFCVAKERKPTNCCVRRAGGETKEGIGPFCCIEPGIATIGGGITPCAFGKTAK